MSEFQGEGTSSVLTDYFWQVKTNSCQVTRQIGLLQVAAEQGQGRAIRLLPVSQSHPWWAGLLLVPGPQVIRATSGSMLAGLLLGVQISMSLPRPLEKTTSDVEQLELVIGLLPGPQLGLQTVDLLLGLYMMWFLPAPWGWWYDQE